jgi:hypothetical protein
MKDPPFPHQRVSVQATTPVSVIDRLHWARRNGHPAYVWPDIPIAQWRSSVEAIEAVIATILAFDPVRPTPVPCLNPPAGANARAVGIAAFTSGTGPLLGRWVEERRLQASPDVATILAEHLAHGRLRAVRMRETLHVVLDALSAQHVEPLILKGAHTGSVYFPEPATRPAADIDLSVRPDQVAAASAAMTRIGYVPQLQSTRPHRCDWVKPDAGLPVSLDLTHEDNPISIEVHAGLDRTYAVRRLSFAPYDISLSTPWSEFGAALVPAQPLLFAYLAAHTSEELHRIQLLRLIELVLVARRDFTSPAHWSALRELVRELEAGRFLYPAVALAARFVPGCIDADTLSELEADAPPRMRRVVARLQPATAQRLERLSIAERFIWARGPVEVVRHAAYLLWPARSRSLRTIYAERLWRVLRGRISLGSGGKD